MIESENRKSLAIGIPGIALQILGSIMRQQPGASPAWTAAVLLGTVLLIAGLAFYARAKGRNPAWGLMGLLSLVGLIILALLKDHARQRIVIRS